MQDDDNPRTDEASPDPYEAPGDFPDEPETATPDTTDRRGVVAWMAGNGVAANVLMLVLIVGGLMTFGFVKQEVFPEVELDAVIVEVAYPGASPAEVEQGVTLAVEEATRGLDGVKRVTSTVLEGSSVTWVELLLGADTDRALNDVKSAVDRIASMPLDAEEPNIIVPTNRNQVISVVFYGDVSEQQLYDITEDARFELLEHPEITYVDISGIRPLEISVEVPQETLRQYGLSLDQIADRLRAASVELPGGGVKTRGGEILLRTSERRDRGTEFAEVVVLSRPDGTNVRLGDIATVKDGFAESDRSSFFNGKRAAMVNVYRVGDQTPLEVAAAVHDYVAKHRGGLPRGLEVSTWNDSSEIFADRVDLLERNAYIGLALVLLVLGLFLEPKLAFWVTLGIPISFAGSMLLLPSAEVSINMISLFAFIVTLGMVVDDAIVVGEAIYYKRQKDKPLIQSAIEGVKEVAQPVTFSILTTCIAFAPMLFVPGIMGKFFRVIPIVVISVLLISLVESLFVLPAHLAHNMPRWLRILLWPLLALMALLQYKRVGRGLGWFIRRAYEPVLRGATRWRYVTFAVAIASFIATMGLVAGGRLEFTFMPKIEGDVINAKLRMPVGTSVVETERITDEMVRAAQAIIEAESNGKHLSRGVFADVATSTNFGGSGSASVGGSHVSSVMVYLVQSDQRAITTAEFAERWRKRIGEIPGAEALTFNYSIGADSGAPIDIQLSHADPDVLESAAARLASELESYAGLRDIDSGVSTGKEQLDFHLTPEGRARGLTEAELARQVRSGFFGAQALRQQRGRSEVRVYVRRPLDERQSLHDLETLVIQTPDGGEMPLGQAAEIVRGRAYTSISRVDGKRVISVTADIVDGVGNANRILAKVTQAELPKLIEDVPGLTYSMGGEQEQQADSMAALGNGFVMALIIMYGLLAVAFRSYAQPILVLSAIPFGIVGALWGHVMMGYGLSMMTMMGVVALSGVVVNDSLILIAAVNDFRRDGLSARDAVIAGGTRRFRPILLTSLTTFFGLAPMILEPSVQARFLVPMAISLGFGVLFATFIMLLLVPATYLMLEDAKGVLGKIGGKLRAPAPTEAGPSPRSDARATGGE